MQRLAQSFFASWGGAYGEGRAVEVDLFGLQEEVAPLLLSRKRTLTMVCQRTTGWSIQHTSCQGWLPGRHLCLAGRHFYLPGKCLAFHWKLAWCFCDGSV